MATDAEVRELEQRLASAVGTLNLATAAVVGVLAEVFASGAWEVEGIRSRAQWVMWQVGCSRSRAEGLVALASRCEELPAVVERFEAGELSEDAAAAIAKRVPAERDVATAEVAPMLTYPQLRRALRLMATVDGATDPPRPPVEREVSFFYDDQGAFRGAWCVPADEGAVLEQALRRARDDLFHAAENAGETSRITWADALVGLASTGVAVGIDPDRHPAGHDNYVVNMFVDTDRPGAPTWLHLGPLLDAETRRLCSCDGSVRALLREKGQVVAKGRTTRTVGATLRALVIERDGGCRHPLCTNTRWLDAHHLWHWEDGGPTDPSNLVCLCRAHHRAHHRAEFTIEGNPEEPDGLRFLVPAGWEIRPPQPPSRPPSPPPDPPPGWRHPLGGVAPSEALGWAAA
jgi:hypothetical protein